MPNIANIDRLIEVIRPDEGKHFLMSIWAAHFLGDGKNVGDLRSISGIAPEHHEVCRTAYCLCGHINHIILTEERPEIDLNKYEKMRHQINMQRDEETPHLWSYSEEMGDRGRASQWLGIDDHQGFRLFLMEDYRLRVTREWFDKLKPSLRAQAAIAVLEILKETGKVSWYDALKSTVPPHLFKKVDDYDVEVHEI